MKTLFLFGVICAALVFSGCGGGAIRGKGGMATHSAAGGAKAVIVQPENPKDAAEQGLTIEDVQDFVIPAGSVVTVGAGTNAAVITLASNAPVHTSHSEASHAKVGAAQPDTVGEIAARLKAVRWLSVVGVMLCVGGLALAFVPYLELFMGGITPGLAIAGGGLVVAALPYVIVGNEKLLIVGAVLSAAVSLALVWVHKHGGVVAELKTLKTKI